MALGKRMDTICAAPRTSATLLCGFACNSKEPPCITGLRKTVNA
jgi:hypothetical protein